MAKNNSNNEEIAINESLGDFSSFDSSVTLEIFEKLSTSELIQRSSTSKEILKVVLYSLVNKAQKGNLEAEKYLLHRCKFYLDARNFELLFLGFDFDKLDNFLTKVIKFSSDTPNKIIALSMRIMLALHEKTFPLPGEYQNWIFQLQSLVLHPETKNMAVGLYSLVLTETKRSEFWGFHKQLILGDTQENPLVISNQTDEERLFFQAIIQKLNEYKKIKFSSQYKEIINLTRYFEPILSQVPQDERKELVDIAIFYLCAHHDELHFKAYFIPFVNLLLQRPLDENEKQKLYTAVLQTLMTNDTNEVAKNIAKFPHLLTVCLQNATNDDWKKIIKAISTNNSRHSNHKIAYIDMLCKNFNSEQKLLLSKKIKIITAHLINSRNILNIKYIHNFIGFLEKNDNISYIKTILFSMIKNGRNTGEQLFPISIIFPYLTELELSDMRNEIESFHANILDRLVSPVPAIRVDILGTCNLIFPYLYEELKLKILAHCLENVCTEIGFNDPILKFIQKHLAHLSQELCQELVNVILEKLTYENASPSKYCLELLSFHTTYFTQEDKEKIYALIEQLDTSIDEKSLKGLIALSLILPEGPIKIRNALIKILPIFINKTENEKLANQKNIDSIFETLAKQYAYLDNEQREIFLGALIAAFKDPTLLNVGLKVIETLSWHGLIDNLFDSLISPLESNKGKLSNRLPPLLVYYPLFSYAKQMRIDKVLETVMELAKTDNETAEFLNSHKINFPFISQQINFLTPVNLYLAKMQNALLCWTNGLTQPIAESIESELQNILHQKYWPLDEITCCYILCQKVYASWKNLPFNEETEQTLKEMKNVVWNDNAQINEIWYTNLMKLYLAPQSNRIHFGEVFSECLKSFDFPEALTSLQKNSRLSLQQFFKNYLYLDSNTDIGKVILTNIHLLEGLFEISPRELIFSLLEESLAEEEKENDPHLAIHKVKLEDLRMYLEEEDENKLQKFLKSPHCCAYFGNRNHSKFENLLGCIRSIPLEHLKASPMKSLYIIEKKM